MSGRRHRFPTSSRWFKRLGGASGAFFCTLSRSLVEESRYRIGRLTVFQFALRLLILVLGIRVIYEICSNQPLLDVVNVPKEFQDRGYTADVVARRIRDQIISEINSSSGITGMGITSTQHFELATDSSLPDLQLPEGVSLKAGIVFLRQVLHFPPDRIILDLMVNEAVANSGNGNIDNKEATFDQCPPLVESAAVTTGGEARSPSPLIQLDIIVRRFPADPSPRSVCQIPFSHPEDALAAMAQTVLVEADPSTAYYVIGIEKLPQAAHMMRDGPTLTQVSGYTIVPLAVLKDAQKYFEKAIAYDQTNGPAYVALGVTLQLQGNIGGAICNYQQGTHFEQSKPTAYLNWGNALQQQGKYDDAIKKYRLAKHCNPNYAEVYLNWGNALVSSNRSAEAIEEYKLAAHFNPQDPGTYYQLGSALKQLASSSSEPKHSQLVKEADDAFSHACSLNRVNPADCEKTAALYSR